MDKALILFGVWIGALAIITAIVAWFTRDREPKAPALTYMDVYVAQGIEQLNDYLQEVAQ